MKTDDCSASREEIRRFSVPAGNVALMWLGQAGFVLKSPGGTVIALDPYLSDSCADLGRTIGVDFRRQVPAPLAPRDLLACDALVFTHSHQDHLDPQTIGPILEAGKKIPFLAPHEAAHKLGSLGVPGEDILLTWPNCRHQVGDFSFQATFAIPLGPDDLTHVGYLVEVAGGPRLYFTGDTDYNDILSLSVAPAEPDIMITVINPAFRNLSPSDAARLAGAIRPRWVIPCHHDLFPDNSLPARLLRTNLLNWGMEPAFCPLNHGEFRLFGPDDRREKYRKKAGKR